MDPKLRDLLEDLFNDGTLALRGHSRDDGADWYECPSCGCTKSIKGYAHSWELVTELQHKADCRLKKLYDLFHA